MAKRMIDPDDLDHLLTDSGSGGGNCPALYKVRDGGYVVQGKKLRRRSLRGLRNRSRMRAACGSRTTSSSRSGRATWDDH